MRLTVEETGESNADMMGAVFTICPRQASAGGSRASAGSALSASSSGSAFGAGMCKIGRSTGEDFKPPRGVSLATDYSVSTWHGKVRVLLLTWRLRMDSIGVHAGAAGCCYSCDALLQGILPAATSHLSFCLSSVLLFDSLRAAMPMTLPTSSLPALACPCSSRACWAASTTRTCAPRTEAA